jgi:glycosyltransferase involved in cell wall biosynthesis
MLVDGDATNIKKVEQPKVSIVVPCYNVCEVLPTAMESLVNQTLKKIEIICIDDASQDETLIQLEKYAKLDQRVKVIRHENNMSSFQSRIDGIYAAKGEYIMFLDPDDWFKLDACERAHNTIVEKKIDVLQFGVFIVPSDNVDLGRYDYITKYLRCSNIEVSQPHIPNAIFDSSLFTSTVWNKIYRKSRVQSALESLTQSIYINMGDDLLFWSIIVTHIQTLAGTEEPLYYYRFGNGVSTKTDHTKQELIQRINDCKTFFTIIDQKLNLSLSPEIKKICNNQKKQVLGSLDEVYSSLCSSLPKTERVETRENILKTFENQVKFTVDNHLELDLPAQGFIGWLLEPSTKKPAISCVMPFYNNEKTVEQTVSTLVSQTFENFELILVNDSSTDNSLNIVQKLAKKDPRISILSQVHAGAGTARNLGLDRARGKYITFLDSDDWFSPSFFEKLYASIRECGSDVTFCRFENFENNLVQKDELYFQVSKFPKTESFTWRDFSSSFLYSVPFPPWTKLYNLSFLKKNHLQFQELYRVNDVYFWGASSVLARKMSFVDEVLVRYRVSDPKRNGDVHDGNLTAFFDAFEQLSVFYHNQHLWDEVYVSFVNALVTSLMYGYRCLGSEEAKRNYIQLLNTRGRRVFQLDQIKLTDIDRDYVDIFIDLQDLLV